MSFASWRRWRSAWDRTRRISHDTVTLLSQFAGSQSPMRDIVIDQARRANSAAVTFLSWEREIGLVRYHGLFGYIKERNLFRRFIKKPSQTSFVSSSPPARIAFMITAAQRKELSESLGYTRDQIKKLKPQEASLILEHRIPPHELDARLPLLLDESDHHTNKDMPSPEHVSQSPGGSDNNEALWYQVVEVRKTGPARSVGMYKSPEEAKLCMDIKRNLASKHNPDHGITYEIREKNT